MRLYDEAPKGAFSERGLCFGREQNGAPGESHEWERAVQAREATEMYRRRDPSYNPASVDGLGEELIDKRGMNVSKDAMQRPGLEVRAIQRTYMSHRDFVPDTQSILGQTMQRFARGFVGPEKRERGMSVVDERGATDRMNASGRSRFHAEQKKTGRRAELEVSALGELEPRMGIWGHEAKDRQPQWFSPPGMRQLARRDRVVATQGLRGLGDLYGVAGLGDLAASYQIWPDGKTALAKGYGQLFYQGGAVAITTPKGALAIADAATVYPTMTEALKRGYGYLYQSGAQVVVTGPAGPTPINNPTTSAPPPAPTPVSALAPPPTKPGGVLLPPPPAPGQPTAPNTATSLTTPTTAGPGSIITTPTGTAAVAPNLTLTPIAPSAPATPGLVSSSQPPASIASNYDGGDTSSGGGSSYYSPGNTGASAPPAPAPVPAGPFAFLQAPIALPLVGSVPTWMPLAAAVALLLRKRRREREGVAKNQKKGKKR